MENQEQQRRRETHAPERNPNPCPLYRKCGGCQLQNMSYQRQLHWKQELVERLLGRFHRVNPIIGMEHPYHYRNKVQAAFALDRRKQIVSGVYQASTHRVVPVESCMIEDETADRIVGTIRKLMKDFKMEPYNEDTGRGLVRHVLVKRGFVSGQVMVVMVTVSPILPAKNNFVKALRKAHPEITTILQNVNNRATSMVLGESEKVLYGPGYIEESLCGCVFRISAKSFYQINPVQTEVLYNKAIELAGFTGKETVVDAYCGTGTIGLIAAKRGAGHVTGVELNQDAVRDAISNAKRNGIKNVYFYNADAGEFLSAMADEGETVDVVLMDPPRAGSDEQFLTSLAGLAPKKIVYISCNPETLQRDLQFLVRAGYHVQEIQPVDMFPHTNHVETVVLLSKGEIDSKKVRVEFSLEDMDMSGFQKGATYEQIKAYVLEHTGLKVSSLYISQIKRKCGLDVGQNYNLSKKEDAKVPQCPPEKEAAIMEALKHFQMI
ncbi:MULTISPECIES: 23S rRNA (uracil(1939)-C(5))-methyltransferase RlmD [Anaeromassilibacillus]|uniref:23S rRNA (Uracil(1939)-C(5))-methyltransferase RlmD n=1 Tax=Anaeromassilibacillus senegalensis TaxID=1673717 RepID=A0ABS9MF29_9FIRM|nr:MULTISPECIES: 23S rRNA (uracil(1939)-C(5))-methyltransferase RlmD [Anaeromassilibacillus]MCG4609410.1 23S rRNA (uracil(1939)-C(5))-methyltransferase RlmD [Anaeromassilibacillus senegalensis]